MDRRAFGGAGHGARARAAQWAPRSIALYSQQPDGSWKACLVDGGLFQGGCDGHPCFCWVMAVMWIHVSEHGVKAYMVYVAI